MSLSVSLNCLIVAATAIFIDPGSLFGGRGVVHRGGIWQAPRPRSHIPPARWPYWPQCRSAGGLGRGREGREDSCAGEVEGVTGGIQGGREAAKANEWLRQIGLLMIDLIAV